MVSLQRPLSTPVLIGRDDLLALGRRRTEDARAGHGQLVFLAGEAGIGKSRLLGAISRDATRNGMRVVQAGAFASDLELPGAVLLDLGHALATARLGAHRAAGAAMLASLVEAPPADDPRRQRRFLVLEIVDRIAGLAAGERPVMVALEDLHWADDLTLEMLGRLARRLADLRMLIVGTYRSDELYPGLPMRALRARLLTQRQAEEVKLARLTVEQTGQMAKLILEAEMPPSSRFIEDLQRRSDGIPLHVEEILGATKLDADAADAGAPSVPDTLTDAVLRRRELLSPGAARIADAAAVIGRSFDLDLVAAVAGDPPDQAAAAIAELESRFFVVPIGAAGWFELRHALIRDALALAVPISQRRRLHELVARQVAARPTLADAGFLSAHFEAAGLYTEAHAHARRAAAAAAGLSAHREALGLYRRAIRCAPADLPVIEQADLLAACAAEEAATDDNQAAAASYGTARRMLLAADEPGRAAALLPSLVDARHLLGASFDVRVAMLRGGLAEIGPEPDAGDDEAVRLRGRLTAGLAAAYMLDRRLDDGAEQGERAIRLAVAAGDETTEINAMTTLGAVLSVSGRTGGLEMLEEAVRRARAARLEAEAARAYRMLGSLASVMVEYERGERWLREGIEYAERTEQWNHRHYMAAHLGHVLWASGEWKQADEITRHVNADGRGGITTRITALHVLGYLALGRGEWDAAESSLSEARELGEGMSELQRFSPALWGLAEAAHLQGRHQVAIDLTAAGQRASAAVRDAAYLFPFLVTGTRARLAVRDLGEATRWFNEVSAGLTDRSIAGTLPAVDHARGLIDMARGSTGRAREALASARAAWIERHRAWEGCAAAIDLARCELRTNRPALAASLIAEAKAAAEAMGAVPLLGLADELDSSIRARGVEDDPWAPLTSREFEVASLIAAGRTNREIAVELRITPKTVASHVEHILGRLGADRRTEIAAWVVSVRPEAPSGRS